MLNRLKSTFAPPTFQDEEKTRVAQVLNTILWFTVGIFGLTLLSMPFTAYPLQGAAVVASLMSVSAVALVLLRRGRVRLVARFFLIFLWTADTILVALSGGIVNPQVAGFIVVIMAAGLLAGMQTAVVFAGLSLLSALGIYILEANGLLMTVFSIDPFAGFIIASINIVLASGLVHLALSGLDQALRRVGDYARELEQERATLEQRVSERTASAEAARQEAELARQEAEAARREAEAERERVQAINALNDIMRGEQDVAQLAENIIQYLCRHLNAQTGALFVIDATGDRFELAGSYAYASDGRFAPQFELGEGLVGQAALEKRTIALDNIPSGELTIRSALGQHAPRHILIQPLVYENRAVGAVELGTFSRFSAARFEFLQRAANDVAAVFHTAQTRKQVNDLLLQTQQQAEELQAQEEELRAINEELQAQAESLQAQRQLRSEAGGEKNR
jgi:hypothetical protein